MPQAYAHLLPEDVEVWKRFLSTKNSSYFLLEYDVRVGLGRDPGTEYDPNIRQMALDLSLRRIDCVAHGPEVITVIEITHTAGLKAVGQMVSYPILYKLTYVPHLPVTALLVAGELQSDVEAVLVAAGLKYVLV